MKVVVAIDSFKGSLSSFEAGTAVKEAVLSVDPTAEALVCSIADGGEGTVAALRDSLASETVELCVADPLMRSIAAEYIVLSDGKTAVIEMAAASGLTLLSEEERNPYFTTTFGVGEMIKDAISRGCRRFILGLGGSATNDGGVGMLKALGFQFLNENGEDIGLGAVGLSKLSSISFDKVIPEITECTFEAACDVENPLCGDNGCSVVFSPQKGASAKAVPEMDEWLNNYASVSKKFANTADKDYPGAGAAGGMGFAVRTFLGGELKSGVDIILNEIGIEKYIKDADIVVTGEGRLDAQTVMGKAPIGVARIAKKYNKSVIAFSGCIGDGAEILNENGIDAFFPILRNVVTLDEALLKDNAYKNLKNTAVQVFRLLK